MNKRQFIKLVGVILGFILFAAACGGSSEPVAVESVAEPETAVLADTADTADNEIEADEPMQIDNGGEVPFYARFGENETFDDGEWTVIVFYRPPSCIPADFNLNQFFHFPGENGPGAFGCSPPTMTGNETWENSPETDPAPLEAEMSGRGEVPIWFVKWAELEGVRADGVTTIEELSALPSRLVGTAATYDEFLRPSQSNPVGVVQFTAAGTLEDGTPFSVDVSKGAADTADHVTIELEG